MCSKSTSVFCVSISMISIWNIQNISSLMNPIGCSGGCGHRLGGQGWLWRTECLGTWNHGERSLQRKAGGKNQQEYYTKYVESHPWTRGFRRKGRDWADWRWNTSQECHSMQQSLWSQAGQQRWIRVGCPGIYNSTTFNKDYRRR